MPKTTVRPTRERVIVQPEPCWSTWPGGGIMPGEELAPAPGARRGWLLDLLAVAALLAIAIPLRFVRLGTLPFGFHGDEASLGLDAQRILDHGWIGVYSGQSGGTPAGPYYAAAVAIHFLGHTVFAARFASACFDTVTVALVYVLGRRNFGRAVGLIAGFLTAVSVWQLEFARLGFINSAWPFCVVAGAAALGEAVRSGARGWWLACGALMASGLYAYPGHLLFLGVLGLFIAVYFLIRPRSWRAMSRLALFVAGLAVAAWPMIQFARNHPDIYFRTGRGVSVFEAPEWRATHGRLAQATFLAHRYVEFWHRLLFHPWPDSIDGTGAAPMVPPVLAAVALVGMALALTWRHRRQPLVWLGALVIVLMPWAVATSNGYPIRRAAIMAPFIALFAAIALADGARLVWRRGNIERGAALLVILTALTMISRQSYENYFDRVAVSPSMYWTMTGDLVHAIDLMQRLPPDAYVYFYAERWPFEDSERWFLAPNVKGESRGADFGLNSYAIDPTKGRPVVILIGRYKELLPAFQLMYPNSSFDLGPNDIGDHPQPSYIVFYPNSPTPLA